MSMAKLQLYKNPWHYPTYGSITPYGNPMDCVPVGTGLKTGKIKVKGNMADFMSCNYLSLTRSGKTIYAWIEDVYFHTANSFELSYRVDAWRTYKDHIDLGTQFIERSNIVTYKRDDLLGATQAHPEVLERIHNINNSSNRVLVVQTRVYDGEQFSNTPVHPTPYRFFFLEYNIHYWTGNQALNSFMTAITGSAKPENIVTLYSIPWVDISHLPTVPLTILPSNVSIPGFKMLDEQTSMQGRLFNETKIMIEDLVNIDELLRVDHSVQVVIPDAGIISIPDYMLKDGDLYLRQDVDMFSGASNYMVVSQSKFFTQSVRGSAVSSIPIVSDPMDTYISQNQNALTTALIGDVASIVTGGAAAYAAGGLGTAIGASMASSGLSNIVNRFATIQDMQSKVSNPPAFLGTALASSFNQIFWLVITRQPVDNANLVHSNFGYPLNKIAPLTFPSSGYVKTQGCTVTSDGTVPQWAIDEINNMFNNGIYVVG